MDTSNSTKDMERIELPKLKKAFVSLQKLDMLTQMPISEDGNENNKENADILKESEDPSSESVSTGSAESNVVYTDDDDLEKKIQAFSIPVKKDDVKPSSKTENESTKNHSGKGAIIEKKGEGIKPGKKQTFKSNGKTKEKSALKTNVRTSCEPTITATPKAVSVSRGTRKKKEKEVKSKTKTDNEKKGIMHVADKEQKLFNANSAKPSDVNNTANKTPLEHNLRNGKGDKYNEKNTERTTRKDEPEHLLDNATGSDVSRKRKVLKDENTRIRAKKLLAEKKNLKLPNEPTSSAPNKEKKKRSMDVKLRSDSIKRKKILPSKDPSKLSDHRPLHVKRSARISGAGKVTKYDIQKNPEKKLLRSKTQRKSIELGSNKLQKSKIEVRKRHSSSRDRSDVTSKLKTNETGKVENKMKEKASEKSINVGVGKKVIHNSSMIKESTEAVVKVTGVRKDSKQTCNATEKEPSNFKETKSDDLSKKMQKSCSGVFEEGEELFEKICDLLEEASGVSESGNGIKRNVTQNLYLSNQETVFPSNEGRLLMPDPFFFKPRIVRRNSKFPSQGKGTVSYKKLWKWSHYVKMPSDMWSIHKHPDGSFVIVFHISEMSPFPKLIIDKCIIFKETASPCVKIYGKDVLALSSENELQTLGTVCSFLKLIHDISLCEGMFSPMRGESNNNCELYTDGKVSLPYKCKSCL